MVINLAIPDSIEQVLREQYGCGLERRILEDLVVVWFNAGLISSGKVGELLGLSWMEAQAFLKSRSTVDVTAVKEVFGEVDSIQARRASLSR